MTERRLKPVALKGEFEYVPVLSPSEHAAYSAAHRIMTEQAPVTHLATPGARRSAQMDQIAGIILDALGHSRLT